MFIIWSIGGCTSLRCFRKTGLLQRPVKIRNLSELSWREQWQGIVFNGDKVGFTRLKINPAVEAGLYNIASETYPSVRFMGIDKMIHLIGFETVRPDLTLSSFHYELKMDAQPLWIDGDVREGQLRAILTSASKKRILQKPVNLVYPASTVNLYPLLKGLVVGDHYRYEVFDPHTQTLSEVEQTVEAFEQSHQLMIEPSFRIETVMLGQRASTWINLRREAIFELRLNGIIIMYKEDESRARSYLSETAWARRTLSSTSAL
jgi:hypothetical protein